MACFWVTSFEKNYRQSRLNSTTAVAFNSRVTDNILRAGVNYKFDPNDIWAFD